MEESNLFQDMIAKGLKQVQIPSCDICHNIIVSGAIPFLDENGIALNICMKCVLTAVRYYMKTQKERLEL
jgi:hypothetical protein